MTNYLIKKNVLLCGYRCFAARGLVKLLQSEGHKVVCFSRGGIARDGDIVTGSVFEIHENPYLKESFDTVINFILLQGESVEDNIEYIKKLIKFCDNHSVNHLIHISSCSAYRNNAKHINENSPIETKPSRKGPYGAIKAAQEIYITEHAPNGLKISHLRPGLILANGMGGYIGGVGLRLPWNTILGLGNAKSQLPLVTRDAVNRAVLYLINNPPALLDIEHLLLADSPSPTRRDYLNACCESLGVGMRVRFFPVWLWLSTAFVADLCVKLIGLGKLGILSKVSSVCRYQEFDAQKTEKRVSVLFSRDWKAEMLSAFDFQSKNYEIPTGSMLKNTHAKKITYIGHGRIVKQRHLPSLKKLGFNRAVEAYDILSGKDSSGNVIKDIAKADFVSSDLFVVATPGPVHIQAITLLKDAKGPVMVEKPIAYNNEELSRWIEFAACRSDPVYVCHDHRYKKNILEMMTFMKKNNPGKLHNVSVVFQTTPVNRETIPWIRNERKARTLLMDYGVHFIDLACMFGYGEPRLIDCRYQLNGQGETCLIEANAAFDNYTINMLLRQGINQRRTRLIYTFENYSITIGFAPDIFVPHMADENFGLSLIEAKASLGATLGKVTDRLLSRESETSHAHALQAALTASKDQPLEVNRLVPTYKLLFQISRSVYGE